MKKEKGPLILLNLDKPGPSSKGVPPSPQAPPDSLISHAPAEAPVFATSQKRPWLLADLFRALLIALSLVVAAGFILVLLPQPNIDQMTRDLQSRHGTAGQEQLSLLYLGDETKDNEFHVRAVVRNITTVPIERLDAAIRLYAHDGSVLETTVVRLNKETIAPDETGQFDLVYPNYQSEFAKYSVEFKLREGGVVPYKDMRTTR
jgi:hypothetical protein